MDEQPGLSEQYRRASPWPVFVALGIPIAEVGILFNLLPVAVGGLLLFCGSVAGMTDEAGYARSPWRPLLALAVVCFGVGAAFLYFDPQFPDAIGLADRGYAVVVAGALILLGGLLGPVVVGDDATPV
jgi:hypothetical protein